MVETRGCQPKTSLGPGRQQRLAESWLWVRTGATRECMLPFYSAVSTGTQDPETATSQCVSRGAKNLELNMKSPKF